MSSQYNEYLRKHINGVQKAYQWLVDNGIIEPFYLVDNITRHDDSKYSMAEYDA